MTRRIAIVQGHPDSAARHFCHALADSYAEAAKAVGHEVRRVEVAQLSFPLLRSDVEWRSALPAGLEESQTSIRWADHLVILFPLWLGTMPALLKAFFEQTCRPGFAVEVIDPARGTRMQGLKGKSARVVVTMGMPSIFYRCFFLSHGVKCLERNILKFCGVSPVRKTFIGLVESSDERRRKALERMRKLGRIAR